MSSSRRRKPKLSRREKFSESTGMVAPNLPWTDDETRHNLMIRDRAARGRFPNGKAQDSKQAARKWKPGMEY